MILPKDQNWQAEETNRLNHFQMVDPDKLMSSEEAPRGAHMLLDGMHTSLSDLEEKLANEKDKNIRKELERKKGQLEKALSLRTAPIKDKADFGDAIDTIKHDQFLIERLEKTEFDQIDIKFLMESDLMPFFDETSQGELAASFEQMNTSDFVQNTLRPKTVHLESKPGEARKLVGFPSVMQATKPEVIEKIKLTLREAQHIRVESILAYLEKRFKALRKLVKSAKGDFEDKAMNSLEEELDEAKRLLFDRKGQDPSFLETVAENIEAATLTFHVSEDEMKQVMEKRVEIEEEVLEEYGYLRAVLSNLDEKQVHKLIDLYREEQEENGFSKNSAIVTKATIALMNVNNPDSELNEKMTAFTRRLENVAEISDEELAEVRNDLSTLIPKLALLENFDTSLAEALSPENQDAKLAHKTIQELERTQDPDDIRKILESNLGAEHLEFVSHREFEKEHRQFTKEGHMVFQEEGEKWKIIIDESVFQEGKSLEILKKQLTHELLHLEFEKSDRVKADVRQALVEADPNKWQQIRKAYLKHVWKEYKTPPKWTKEDEGIQDNTARKARFFELWEDDDILSELYAMQNEMGQNFSKGGTAKDNLNNLLTGMGVGAAIGDIAKKTRGYGEGVEAPDESGPPSRSISTMESLTKEEAVYHGNHEKIQKIRERLKELKGSDYLSLVPGASELRDAMDDYNEDTDFDLNDDLHKDPESEVLAAAIAARIGKVEGDLSEVEDKVGKAARKAPNTEIGLLRRLWISTTFLSMGDFVQMGTDAYEFIQRRQKRKQADHAAKLGMALFGGTDLGREARARQQKAESEEVNEWKSRYESMDAWQLMDEMRGIANSIAPNRDQLKAILRILADKGRINWRDENLWMALNKLQSAVPLKPGDQLLLHNPILLRQRLRSALGEIYDYDEFETLERTNESSYQSEKGKYDTRHSRMQDQLNELLDEMLSQHKAGEQVDPILYESIMEYSIKNGKSYAENVMFHLIAGMAEGLLAPDRGLALGDHLNTWPAVDWFTSMDPPMSQADWKRLCMAHFPKDFMKASITAEGYGIEFKNFYWTTVQNSPRVVERVKKSVSERSWDHDWGRSIACMGDADTAKRFLAGRSGQQETKSTAVGNAYVGAIMWLEENARNPQFASKENFARMAGWLAMSEGILYGTAYNRAESDISTRENEAMNQDVPREASVGRYPNASLRQHRDMAEEFLMTVDPYFFGMLSGREARSKEQKAEIGIAARDYLMQRYPQIAADLAEVAEIDQIYNNLDLIIKTIFNQMSEAQFQAILSRLAART